MKSKGVNSIEHILGEVQWFLFLAYKTIRKKLFENTQDCAKILLFASSVDEIFVDAWVFSKIIL